MIVCSVATNWFRVDATRAIVGESVLFAPVITCASSANSKQMLNTVSSCVLRVTITYHTSLATLVGKINLPRGAPCIVLVHVVTEGVLRTRIRALHMCVCQLLWHYYLY